MTARRPGAGDGEGFTTSAACTCTGHESLSSGGQRQRVGLAHALSVSPRLLIADEPVSALDMSVQAQVLNLMKSLLEQHHLSLLITSHDLAVARHPADTIGIVDLGKLVEMGPADNLLPKAAASPHQRPDRCDPGSRPEGERRA